MSEADGSSALSTPATRGGILTQLGLAASFLTIIPTLNNRPRPPEAVAASFRWFPLIGFAIGALLCLEDSAASRFMGPSARAILAVMTLAVVTGAVHLDGLADTADALGAGRDRARALEIMRDSRIGTFGAVALFFLLLLKVSALANAVPERRSLALYLAPGLARWAMVMVAERMAYLRCEGAGAELLRQNDQGTLLIASAIAAAGTLAASKTLAIRGALTAVAFALLLRAAYRRWLGGVTGDLIGAAGEIVETAVIIALCT
ncbi:MAG TPA: adenosylcobinamide-GDP ribazoletransferase [Candidatus Binataceae bacterium]|nr:adenosylcobinamide-GDP ribazoletransferase [Candidatus Binataceae bacterium]